MRQGFNLVAVSPTVGDDATAAALFSMTAAEALRDGLLGLPWNEPHFCTHEGPWTLRSCYSCDVHEAKAIVALIAWLTGNQKILDRLRSDHVQCMHRGASRYEYCRQCRIDLWYAAPAGAHPWSSLMSRHSRL